MSEISISVNGEQRSMKAGSTVETLLLELNVPRTALAVERNREIVPRTEYAEIQLADGDKLEIVSLVGGG